MEVNINKLIKDAVLEAIHRNVEAIFEVSQDDVPVRTGELKFSGHIIETDNGSEIEYTADHAKKIEYGMEGQDVSGEETTVYVPAHRRKDGTYVKGHYKTYKGKVVRFKPSDSDEEITRVFTKLGELPGRYFLTNAVYEEIPNFIEDLSESLEDVKWGVDRGIKRVEIKFQRGNSNG